MFVSLICVSNLENLKSLGRIGIKSVSFYILTTFLAISLSLTLASILNPGEGVSKLTLPSKDLAIQDAPSFIKTTLNIIPSNPFKSLAEGNMLQVIFFSILIGY